MDRARLYTQQVACPHKIQMSAPTLPPLRPSRLHLPPVVLLGGLLAATVIIGPIAALFVRVPWHRVAEVAAAPETFALARVTLASALLSMVITTLLGVPLALWLRSMRRGANVARLLTILPLALPPVVSGLALTAALGRRGITAPILEFLGVQFGFAFAGVVTAHVFISLPFVVVAVDQALRHLDPEIIASAAGLGLRPTALVFKIILPSVAPAIVTGAGLALSRSLGEFGATLTFAGSLPGVTRTMPLGIYLEREIDTGRALVLAFFLIMLATIVLAATGAITLFIRPSKQLFQATDIGSGFDPHALRDASTPTRGGADISIKRGALQADFRPNSITAVIGPNGAGKSTLAHLISGRLRGANVIIDAQPVDGEAYVPAHRRGVVLLTQRHGLPVHTTVHKAIAMVAESSAAASTLIRAAGLQALEHIKIASLSGGQAAQVALVRALATRPRTLILDEPLAALDVAAAQRWREYLLTSARDRTTILISHNPLEIASLAESIVVLERGETVTHGTTTEILTLPPNNFVAQLAGINRIQGTIISTTDSTAVLETEAGNIHGIAQTSDLEIGAPGLAICNPEATSVRLDDAPPITESTRNHWRGIIHSIESSSSIAELRVAACGTIIRVPITTASASALKLNVGDNVWLATKATAIRITPLQPRIQTHTRTGGTPTKNADRR